MSSKKGKYQNRDAYLNAALDIIHEHGVEKLTMRKVAEQLNVSAMAIYKHFPRKDDLLSAALDEFIARADVIPEADLPWRDWIEQMATAMYRALQSEPNWLPWLGTLKIGPNALAVTSAFLQKLGSEGLDFAEAVQDFLRLIHILVGAVSIDAAVSKTQARLLSDIYGAMGKSGQATDLPLSQLNISLPLLLDHIAAELTAP